MGNSNLVLTLTSLLVVGALAARGQDARPPLLPLPDRLWADLADADEGRGTRAS